MARTQKRRSRSVGRVRFSSRQRIAIALILVVLGAAWYLIIRDNPPQQPENNTLPPVSDGQLVSYYIDVGQGDCELVQIPREGGEPFTLLIDCGDAEHGEELVDTLKGMKIDSFDAIVVTHPHADHMGAMSRILQEFETGAFYLSRVPEEQTPTTASYEKMLDALLEREQKITVLAAGDTIPGPDSAEIRVLAPNEGAVFDNLNDYSLVIRIQYGDTAFLYMGDAEEEDYTQAMENGNVQADVIKIGHHGSHNATDEELIRRVSPRYAVISCGRDNSYGHPHQETLEVLQHAGVEVLRTDESGTIAIASDGSEVTLLTA